MTSSVGLLDFFILEASDYVERLDGLLAAAGDAGPDAEQLTRYGRALRGSATMAKQPGMSELAAGVERAARALRDGALHWDPALRGVLVAAVDDLKILLRAVRTWGPAEEQRARARIDELAAVVPSAARGMSPTPTPAGVGGTAFLATAADGIAAALESFLSRSAAADFESALRHARALRGVAAIKEIAPLPEVLAALERAAKPLELGGAAPSPAQRAVFAASAEMLRRTSRELRGGPRADATSPETRRFAAAVASLEDGSVDADRIVPIAELFHADAGPHVISQAPNPPTTPAQRFRLEVVSQAEHLRRLVSEVRAARDPTMRDRLALELHGALRALRSAAEGFGERDVAAFVAAVTEAVASLDAATLGAVDEVATLLANPTTQRTELARRLDELSRGSTGAPGAPPGGAATPAGVRRQRSGRQLRDLLKDSIAGINQLRDTPLSEPVPIVEEGVVPVGVLLYRGRAALNRARELREELRRAGGEPDQARLAELFDLLDLAAE